MVKEWKISSFYTLAEIYTKVLSVQGSVDLGGF